MTFNNNLDYGKEKVTAIESNLRKQLTYIQKAKFYFPNVAIAERFHCTIFIVMVRKSIVV